MSFWSNWFKSDEEKCRELIGKTLQREPNNTFSSYEFCKILDVKQGWIKYTLNNQRGLQEVTCKCNLFMKALNRSNYRICGGIKDTNVFVKGDGSDDWGH